MLWGSSTAGPFSTPVERAFAAHDQSLGLGEPSAISVAAAHAHTAPARRVSPTAHLARSELGRRLANCQARSESDGKHRDGYPQAAHGVLPQRPISTTHGSLIRWCKESPRSNEPSESSRSCRCRVTPRGHSLRRCSSHRQRHAVSIAVPRKRFAGLCCVRNRKNSGCHRPRAP